MAQEALKREDLQDWVRYSIAVNSAKNAVNHAEEKMALHVKYLRSEYSLGDGDTVDPKTGVITRATAPAGSPSPEIAGS